jgi:hypothetical protein
MPTTTSVAVQLTRVPYQLRQRAKVHCGPHDATLAQFVIDTFRERLETTPHADESAQRAGAR